MKFQLEYLPSIGVSAEARPAFEMPPTLMIDCICGRQFRYMLSNGCDYDRGEAIAMSKAIEDCDKWWQENFGIRPFGIYTNDKMKQAFMRTYYHRISFDAFNPKQR